MSQETGAWMPMYWADYFGDTLHLTTAEHGAYLLLIGAYWRRGGPLPDDDKYLANVTRASRKTWISLRPVVCVFFSLEEGHWVHHRVEKEILRSSGRLKSARAAGQAGGLAKSKLITPTPTLTPKDTELAPLQGRANKADVDLAVEAWNATAARVGLASVQRLSTARKNLVLARLAECGGLEGWNHAMAKVEASRFLRGEVRTNGHEAWRASFDFIVKQGNFTKLMEGNYDDRKGAAATATNREILEAVGLDGRVESD